MNQRRVLRPEIAELLRLTGLHSLNGQIERIACDLPHDFSSVFAALAELDRSIPGLGQHNINEQIEGGHWTGVYRIEDRAIFRGIQYVGVHLGMNNLDWLTRMIVIDSCYHVEGSLKRKTGITDPLSVGMILHRASRRAQLDDGLTAALWQLNNVVYNNAKHTIEDLSMDGHMFSVADAIAVYFACRMLGARLLKSLGIATKYGQLVFP